MKIGRTLSELAAEIDRQARARRDFIAPVSKALFLPVTTADKVDIRMCIETPTEDVVVPLNELAHRQVGDHLGIPAKYYDRMRTDAPDLLATNVNAWFHKNPGEQRMLRTLDNRLRAFLSDRFRALDYYDLAQTTFPVLADLGVDVVNCEVTDRRMYVKVVDRSINREVGFGEGHRHFKDVLCPAMVIGNSEVGEGALFVDTAVWTEGCTNLAILKARSMRKYHVGARHEITEQFAALLSDQTKRLSDAATWAQVRDVVKGAFDQARFDAEVAKIAGMTDQKLGANIPKAVEVAARKFGTTDEEGKSILGHLIRGGDLTRYGLFNAITRTAEDLGSYDRATEFERMGGELIELAANDWRMIAEAAEGSAILGGAARAAGEGRHPRERVRRPTS